MNIIPFFVGGLETSYLKLNWNILNAGKTWEITAFIASENDFINAQSLLSWHMLIGLVLFSYTELCRRVTHYLLYCLIFL